MKKLFLLPLVLLIVSCATTSGVINTGPNSYIISISDTSPVGVLMKMVYEEANQKCLQENKKFLQTKISNDSIRGYADVTEATVVLEFRCLDAEHPAFMRADDRRESDKIIEIRND